MMDEQYREAADFQNNENVSVGAEAPAPAPASTPVKVRKHTPQKNVDKFWKKFTTKYPGKVHSVLPADLYAKTKAQKSPKGSTTSQHSGKTYEQAVAECTNAVIRIAKECRRVNAKYRDSHFDIEFDLKRDRRDCLDGLAIADDDDKHWPRSVKRVPDIFENPEFYQDEATASDIRQGFNGDCWFLAALCALSNKKRLISKICVARDEKVGVYGFVFYRDGEWIQTIIDDKLYLIASDWWESSDVEKRTTSLINREDAEEAYRKLNQTGSKALYFAQCRSENETWLPLLEKAYAKAHGDYSAIDGGFTGEAIEDLTGGVTQELFTTDILDKDKFWTDELLKVNEEFLFSCSTGTFDKWQGSDVASRTGARSGVIRLHAYSVMDAVEVNGERLVKVRNPWATDEWRGAWSDGSEQWTAEWLQLLDHKFGDDGIFWISYNDLIQRYSSFDRTRLFGKEWSVAQQWTTLNVSWSADYNETKFSISLTKKSPVVIVLSQLDQRYFKGLTGQYFFELHFRLDRDSSDEYIVRSHGNYSMRRSVSTDIELEAGKYSVLMKITARRFDDDPTPESVIKENVKNRQNKLIQIGLAYDLAHAKGEIRETEQEKQARLKREEEQKAVDKKKERATIRAQNYREWERGKRQRARNKRRDKRRQEYRQRKAEKQKEVEKGESGDTNGVNGTSVAAGLEAAVDKAASIATNASGTQETGVESKKEDIAPAVSGPTAGSENVEHTLSNGVDSNAQQSVANPEAPTSNTNPSQTIEPSAIGTVTEQAPTNGTMTEPEPAAPDGIGKPTDVVDTNLPAAGVPDEDDDPDAYLFSSSASFVSSIDSILDFPEESLPPTTSTATDETTSLVSGLTITSDTDTDSDADGDADDDDDDAKFASDPWNAVCVVGLRVYSKDEVCSVCVVQPKAFGGEETVLDLDDMSKGVSGEKEIDPLAASSNTNANITPSATTTTITAIAASVNGGGGSGMGTGVGVGLKKSRTDTGGSLSSNKSVFTSTSASIRGRSGTGTLVEVKTGV